MIKEVFLGTSIAALIFLVILGYNVLPLLLMGGLGFFLYILIDKKGLPGSSANFSGYVQQVNFTFDDVGGQASAKQELKEALDFVIHAKQIAEMGIRPLKGILLTGPPGTGKTLLAKAAAAYTHSLFLATSGSEFIEVYAGVGAQRVRQLFKTAKERALREKKNGAIIFIDEIDVLGNRRGSNTGHLEYDQTLNQLLVEMDGLRSDDRVKILVIGATNRDDMLDPALLRPGRFDRLVRVDLPDKAGRYQILKLHCRNKPLADDVDLDKIAQETFGFSGAHLESVTNEAAILALREESPYIHQRHFKEAVDKVMMGEKLDRKPSKDELYRIAVHETGHAIVSEVLRPGSVSHITVTTRGKALGYMRQIPEDDLYLYTKDYLEKQIQVFLAGAGAENILLGSQSTGSSSDFQQAVQLAKQIVTAGLSPLGVIWEEGISKEVLHDTIQEIIRRQEKAVEEILMARLDVLQEVAQVLLEEEYIGGNALRQRLGQENRQVLN
ncbi:MAG TPA: AAA family ATPase [Syntrophomonadaceae bacterium]|nr:AAA family ATPase [Syntrophomonadaceae bacterium]